MLKNISNSYSKPRPVDVIVRSTFISRRTSYENYIVPKWWICYNVTFLNYKNKLCHLKIHRSELPCLRYNPVLLKEKLFRTYLSDSLGLWPHTQHNQACPATVKRKNSIRPDKLDIYNSIKVLIDSSVMRLETSEMESGQTRAVCQNVHSNNNLKESRE